MHKMEEYKLTIAATPSGSLTVINCFPEKKFKYWSATTTYDVVSDIVHNAVATC